MSGRLWTSSLLLRNAMLTTNDRTFSIGLYSIGKHPRNCSFLMITWILASIGSLFMQSSTMMLIFLTLHCEGAIMFGDSLLPSECSLIVEELKQTSLCFQVRYFKCFHLSRWILMTKFDDLGVQCAHGRPTTVPLVNLEALHNQIAKLRSMIDCSNDEWHGLRKHRISVERSAQRLCSSGE